MQDLADFPVARKWPARHPERLQLYSTPTPNGFVSIIHNAGQVRTKGVEAALTGKITPELTATAQGSYIKARYGDFPGVSCYVTISNPACSRASPAAWPMKPPRCRCSAAPGTSGSAGRGRNASRPSPCCSMRSAPEIRSSRSRPA